jgi:hypothetical protein
MATPNNLLCVLQQFTGADNVNGWDIRQLDEGGEAVIYAVRSRGEHEAPLGRNRLVVKLYKDPGASSGSASGPAYAEFGLLSQLHAAVSGTVVNGWKVSSPVPLHICRLPPAIVMTAVPGKSLLRCLESGDDVTPEVLRIAPQAVAYAMNQYWPLGQPYGEFSFDNIVSDFVSRNLAFVDPGLPRTFCACENVSREWFPASRDLAYLLFDTAITVRRTLGNPSARRRKRLFAEGVLRTAIAAAGSYQQRQRLLDEIHACGREYLDVLEPSWKLRGMWHLLLSSVASRQMDAMMIRLRSELRRAG